MNGLKVTLLAGAAMLAMAGGASAVTISGGSASLVNTLTDYNQPLSGSLTKFDTSLGTLNSVTFSVAYGFNSSITLTATTDSQGSVRTESAARFSSTDSAVNTVLNAVVNKTGAIIGSQILNPAAYDLLGTNNIYELTAGQSQVFSSLANANNSYTTTNAGYLQAFEAAGGGSFDAIGRTLTGTILQQTGGNASAAQSTLASQSISISYDYTAAPTTDVPEPASLALLGAGLLGLGMIRRKAA